MLSLPAVGRKQPQSASSMEKSQVSNELDSSAPLPDEHGKRADLTSREAEEALRAEASAGNAPASDAPASDAPSGDAPRADNAARDEDPPRDEIHEEAAAEESTSGDNASAGGDAEAADAETSDLADDDDDDDFVGEAEPLELIEDAPEGEEIETHWYILKVQVNRESSICDALERRVKMAGLERFFGKIIVPTEEVQEFTKTGKKRIVKRKLYPGYIMVNMAINDDTWFLVRETPGIGDFTGSAGKPTPMKDYEIASILRKSEPELDETTQVKTAIKVKPGDRVRVKEGYFQNFEGDVEAIDEANGRITVIINIFNRSTPVELEHWQVEEV